MSSNSLEQQCVAASMMEEIFKRAYDEGITDCHLFHDFIEGVMTIKEANRLEQIIKEVQYDFKRN